jgi:hypothetical protein
LILFRHHRSEVALSSPSPRSFKPIYILISHST